MSDVYRVNRKGERIVPCGSPILLNTMSDKLVSHTVVY